MTAVTPTCDSASRYRIEPTVMQALRSPRLLTREVLAGLVVALALIPEAIAFSIIAGVDPRVGLFSSFIMAVAIAFLGGRPAMITAATGAIALVIAPVAREYGMDYIIARKVLKKFESMNVSFVRDEMKGLIEYIEKTFGEGGLPDSVMYLQRIQNFY